MSSPTAPTRLPPFATTCSGSAPPPRTPVPAPSISRPTCLTTSSTSGSRRGSARTASSFSSRPSSRRRAGSSAFLPKPEAPRLGELLVRKGFISDEQLAWALGEARATNTLLGLVLLRERLIFEDELARTLSVQLSIPYIGIKQIGVNPYVARLLPPDVGEAVAAIPVRDGAQSVQVVFADPTDPQALDAVRRHLPEIEVAVAELSDIRLAWRAIAR